MEPLNPCQQLSRLGQSLWLDYIDRQLLQSGELIRLIEQSALKGLTSNPAIFEKALASDPAYQKDMRALAKTGAPAETVFEQLALADIRAAADALHGVYLQSARRDGYVSLEVSPRLAGDSAGTIAEARRLWQAVERDNLMIKVPATEAGLVAIEALIAQGINVNATLLFSRHMYRRVTEAWLSGLERWIERGGESGQVASVASFFVSRIDSAVDALLLSRIEERQEPSLQAALRSLLGKTAIANARLAYQHYLSFTAGPRWQRLAARGAQPQRLLWASTGTKNPAYSDVLYVESLIGPDTVNTVPPATLEAFAAHGVAADELQGGIEAAGRVIEALEALGISLDTVTDQLLVDGVRLFAQAYDKLLAQMENRMAAIPAA
ncbi:MAG: transaldolase [Betaproteobacteria bacterium]|nr:transaldolase [Betaproteobacteria bacterium]MDE2623034.1 transaldolase [Betaproteobacteria bacterium]